MSMPVTASTGAFDVGINDRLPFGQALILGLQHVFGMTGMFVFPGLLGRSFNLPADRIAYLYVMTFFVASLIWCLLSVPIRRLSFIGLFARFLRAPLISGIIVMLTIIQVANVALPNWIGAPSSLGFPLVNIFSGAIAVAVLVGTTLWGGKYLRRGAILIGLATGTICYAMLRPISFRSVVSAPLLVAPQWFPFGFSVRPELVIVFLLVLIPAGMGSMAMYEMVA